MIGRVYWWRGSWWRVIARAEPFIARAGEGPRRNVLIERVALIVANVTDAKYVPTGERVVRPLRGLRRATSA